MSRAERGPTRFRGQIDDHVVGIAAMIGLGEEVQAASNILSIVTCSGRSSLSASNRTPVHPCTPTFDDPSPAVGCCCHSTTGKVGEDQAVSHAVLSHLHGHTIAEVQAQLAKPSLSRSSSTSRDAISSKRVA